MKEFTVIGVWVNDDTPVAVTVLDGVVDAMHASNTEAIQVHLPAGAWREVVSAEDDQQAALVGERVMREVDEEQVRAMLDPECDSAPES